jgi:hypothetical protein|tara:strand:+ start:70 stop:375 length:306 start_codon:yes stop_codon:yes gene_type:complete
MLKKFITTFFLFSVILISCSKYRLHKNAIIVYNSDCNEYLIELSEGPYYLDSLLKPEYLEDEFKVNLFEIEILYSVTDSITYCNLPGITNVISIDNIIKRR